MPLPCSSHSAFKSRCVVRSCGFTLVRLYRIAETLAGLPGTELLWYIWLQTIALVGGSSTLHRYPVDIIQTPIHTHVHWHKGEWIKGRVGGMDGEAHTVIAGMRNRKGWGGCDGLVGVITVAAAMIPDIIRCTFGLNHPRHCQPM